LSLAVLVGGLWSVYTFDALNARDKAKAELSEINRKLSQQAEFDTRLSVKQTSLPGSSNRYLYISVHITNIGSRNTRIDFNDKTIAVAKIEQISGYPTKFGSVIHSPILAFADSGHKRIWNLPYIIIRTGETYRLQAWVQVEKPGLYLVGFKVHLSAAEQEVSKEFGMDKMHDETLAVREFTVVK